MMASPPQSGSDSSPLYVERVRVCNFRGIREVEIELEPNLTVLVGHNNAGKSRLLSAMHLALGGRPAELDDFTVGVEADPSIDIILAPAPPDKIDGEEEFPTAVARRLVDPQTISDSPLRERFGWRTHVRRSAEGFGARAESKQLTFDSAAGQWVERTDAPDLSHPQRPRVAADLVDTGRDLMQELSRRGSSVRRVLSDLEIDPSTRGDLEARLTDLGKAIEVDPKHSQAYAVRAWTYRQMKQLDLAAKDLDSALKLEPVSVDASWAEGEIEEALGKNDKAVAAFKEGIALDDTLAIPWSNLGLAYSERKRFDEAIAAFQQAIALDDNFAIAWSNLGLAYRDLKRFDEAIAAFQQAIALDDKFASA